ncbi:tyrosinase cofactor [Streptomyces sp. NBC_01142]|uniref:apotyrosinase chaperone MelC1 n=1 Tax=Streptomyces sp. NBC_01142 TaxID=2975865 RepID=UPI00225B1D0A|nr:tyrosinase family oxidase copper chaperone [Streptomyces sp. NBC_01142]MCX4821361.1 tyrosinase cofactor [Streptomyces sp. NBC_01142]
MQRLTRRDMVRGTTLAFAGAALAGPAAIAAATASRSGTPQGSRKPGAGTTHLAATRAAQVPEPFDEVYLGRHIEGWPAAEDHDGHDGHSAHGGHTSRAADDGHSPVEFVVRVDDDDLHVMQNSDGTWISVINHYETHHTPRDAARAAVRELHGATLVPVTV